MTTLRHYELLHLLGPRPGHDLELVKAPFTHFTLMRIQVTLPRLAPLQLTLACLNKAFRGGFACL